MMPAFPGATFIIGKTGFTLGPLEALLYAMLGIDDPCQFRTGLFRRCIAQVIIIAHAIAFRTLRNHQQFFMPRTVLAPLGYCQNPAGSYPHNHVPFVTGTNGDFLPAPLATSQH